MCVIYEKSKVENGAKSASLSFIVMQYEREPLKECMREMEPGNILLQLL